MHTPNESPNGDGGQCDPADQAPAREPTREQSRMRKPTPFPRSERAVSQADGEA